MRTKRRVGREPRTDWPAIRAAYEANDASIRALAQEHGLSDTAIRKRAKADGWTRAARPDQMRDGMAAAQQEKPQRPALPVAELTASPVLSAAAETDPRALVEQGREIVGRLLTELSFATSYSEEIAEAIEVYTEDDKDGRRRYAMLKAVELPSRATVMQKLALAAKTLADAAPGKKEEAQDAAAKAGTVGRFATPATPPKLVAANGTRIADRGA